MDEPVIFFGELVDQPGSLERVPHQVVLQDPFRNEHLGAGLCLVDVFLAKADQKRNVVPEVVRSLDMAVEGFLRRVEVSFGVPADEADVVDVVFCVRRAYRSAPFCFSVPRKSL